MAELLILRVHYGIGALEAEHELPAWERDMLIDAYLEKTDDGTSRPAPSGGPFSVVPEELSGL